MNASAVAIFVFSRDVHWSQALVTAIGASFGGWAGAMMLRRVNEKLLKLAVVVLWRRAHDWAVLDRALRLRIAPVELDP